MTTTVIFGPPGTGKTSTLLEHLSRELAVVDPERVAFVSFTKAAVEEATDRALLQFQYSRKQFRWFRTLHAMCFAALGMSRDAMLTDFSEFAKQSGLRFSKVQAETGLMAGAAEGDQFLSGHNLCAALQLPYHEVQRRYGLKIGEYRFERLERQLESFKQSANLIEFQDLFSRFLTNCEPLPVEVAFIDEAQDLTPMQWAVVAHAFKNVKRLYIAGDDDQAIYQWAGADPLRMLALEGNKVVLDKSYRLGTAHVAMAKQVSARISHRQEKHWQAADSTRAGAIHRWWNWNEIDWTEDASWLILARANQFMPALAEQLERDGLVYTWGGSPRIKTADARLFTAYKELMMGRPVNAASVMRLLEVSGNVRSIALRMQAQVTINAPGLHDVRWLSLWPRRKVQYLERVWQKYGRVLDLKSRIELTTIHQAKGTEADNVVLCPDITPATWSSRGDAEHRVFYVAITRTKYRLFLLRPNQEHFYQLP